jgi:hypothetical protein
MISGIRGTSELPRAMSLHSGSPGISRLRLTLMPRSLACFGQRLDQLLVGHAVVFVSTGVRGRGADAQELAQFPVRLELAVGALDEQPILGQIEPLDDAPLQAASAAGLLQLDWLLYRRASRRRMG